MKNVREYRRDNQNWTMKSLATYDTPDEQNKTNQICVGHHYAHCVASPPDIGTS